MLLTRRQPFYPSAAHDKFFLYLHRFWRLHRIWTLAPLLLNDALHQRLDLIEHFVEFTGKQADFIRGGDADTLGRTTTA